MAMPNVKTITQDQLDRLGIDDANNLYWDGKPLVTEERIVLARWVNVAVVIGAVAAALTAIVETLKFLGFGSH
jgi:hypothetical protein